MEYLQLLIAFGAMYLFVLFLAQPFLLAWRVLSDRWSEGKLEIEPEEREDPNSVDPTPVVDLQEFNSLTGYSSGRSVTRLGRDRFNRLVHKVEELDGRIGYYYWDKATHERQRIAARYPKEPETARVEEARLALGWKGFTADSSPWEILGVAKDASISQIKAAYRKLITKYHPDRFSSLTQAEIDQLERDSKLINAAYAELVKS